ncbi:MAG: PilW family protein [Sedimenticola sp.]|nr:PilW family protein [Sedimenticola sp.]
MKRTCKPMVMFRCRPLRKGQAGVGLVELMVGLLLGLFLMAGIMQIYLGTKSSYRVTEGMSRLQENARYAVAAIERELNAAGYMGCLEMTPNQVTNTLGITTGSYDFGVTVTGSEGASGAPDTLTVKRAVGRGSIAVTDPMATQTSPIELDSTDSDYAALQQYQVLTLSDCSRAAVFMITNDPSSSGGTIQHQTGVTSPIGALNQGQSNSSTDLQHIFGAQTGSVATVFQTQSSTFDISGGRLRLNNQELVEGVSDFQVEYGFSTGGTTRYVDAGSVGTNWDDVEAIRVSLTFNSVEPVTDDRQLINRTYQTTFRLRNRTPDKS